jgi:hypothetical protein
MGSTAEPIGREAVGGEASALGELERKSVLLELDAILNSPIFQPSKRCQQFLSYVVHHRLDGNHEGLKERTIGVGLFRRPAGYSTGDDPVVRVQAGEVRRRLEQYYQSVTIPPAVRIGLHLGSYAPDFLWAQPAPPPQQTPPIQARPDLQGAPHPVERLQESPHVASHPQAEELPGVRKRRWLVWTLPAAGLAVLAVLAVVGSTIFLAKPPQSALQQFWSPALSSSEPVLICLAKPSVYLPSVKLYQRHSKTPEAFLSQFQRLSQKPDLQPDDKLAWSDMVEYPDYGLAVGDVYTAIRLSSLFGQIGKKNQVRIGGHYSFEDLRNSPAVIIGAFNNRWTMQMMSDLHFRFTDEGDESIIQEEGPTGRRWHSKFDSNGRTMEDFAVVTRLLNSGTGKFVVVVAGIRSYGTQAAGEFVSGPEYLQAGLQSVSPDWHRRNAQIILQTPVTDGLPGPPQVVASYVW